MVTGKRQRAAKAEKAESISGLASPRTSPLVFISHDTRDADLAEAFGNLLTDASGGMLQSFRSSDRKGTAGIEFGAEWYNSIMSKLDAATDVVALLTHHSINRPWILYESGVAKGKLDTTVLGVAVGIKLEQANTGPFAQFQNCGDDIDSLTKLVLQLIKKNPSASPRAEAVRLQVEAFIKAVQPILKSRAKTPESEKQSEDTSVAKMFEEVKVLVRDLPDRFESRLNEKVMRRSRKRRRMHPMMLEELLENPRLTEKGASPSIGLLVAASTLREDFPWFYELVVDYHRALQTKEKEQINIARRALADASDIILHQRHFTEIAGPEDEEAFFILRHFLERLNHRLSQTAPQPIKNPPKDSQTAA